MKTINILLVLLFVTSISCAQKKSPKEHTEGKIGEISISINYGSPRVKGRTVWGKLVKYDKVWRAGANENTTISFDKNVAIAGNNLSAGKYGFFIIPNEKGEWVVIFNKKNDAWGHFSYKQKQDVLRVNITPEFVNKNQEELLYTVGENSINLTWEKVIISIPVK